MEVKAMRKERGILFGVDESVFAREAIAAAGTLFKDNKNLKITIFHGAPVLDLSILSRVASLDVQDVERYQELWHSEHQEVLRRAKDILTQSGFDPDRVSTVYAEQCDNPASYMYRLASFEDFETLALARSQAESSPQDPMGSVTYRLSNLADDRVLWIIDPRVLSHHVLVTLVGADVSRRVVEHTVHYFSHLKHSTFTLLHVIPPVPPQVYRSSYWVYEPASREKEQLEEITTWREDYTNTVKQIANEGKEKLIKAGVPAHKVIIKVQAQQRGIARDILAELEQGKYGILILGRKGFKDIKQFGLGSKANKLLHGAHTHLISLVN
jgi:nucleotide-binding universal stress UspA family protein